MIYKAVSPLPKHVRVTFELPASLWAGQVYVVGDFNRWSAHATSLQQARDGAWLTTVGLPTDRCYEFRYLIDGKWRTDAKADQCVLHRCHTDTCLVIGNLTNACPLWANCTGRDRGKEQLQLTSASA